MANVYVDSNAAGAGTGADWANAYTSLAAALTGGAAAGDDFWVAHDHAGTSASAVALTSPGTIAAPCRIMCVNKAGTVPPVSADLRTTATIGTTGASSITFGGYIRLCYGITFTAGSGASNAGFACASASNNWNFDACKLVMGTTSAGSNIKFGSTSTNSDYKYRLKNTVFKFAAVGQLIALSGCDFLWEETNTTTGVDNAGSIPTNLFAQQANLPARIAVRGVDLSNVNTTLVAATNVSNHKYLFEGCRLHASVTRAGSPTGGPAAEFVRCSDTTRNYDHYLIDYRGTQDVETTIVRTGGASDGTQAIAWKIVTTANTKWSAPFISAPILVWNDTSGASVTVTAYGIWGGGAVPNNDDIWMEVQYLGNASYPLASFSRSTKADALATGSALASDSSTWGGSTTKFKMTATFTPNMKGAFIIRFKGAAVSSTFYVDPKVVLS